MSHWAKIDENNTVAQVIHCSNAHDEGYDFVHRILGGTWIQTSYNNRFRKQFAGIGYTYDAENDVFIRPRPFNSWLLNGETFDWEPPKPKPSDGMPYRWDEDSQNWISITKPYDSWILVDGQWEAPVKPRFTPSESGTSPANLFWNEEKRAWQKGQQ